MELYTGFWTKRYKRVIGKLSKNKKILEDVFVCIPMPIDGQVLMELSHVDAVNFALDKHDQRIIYNIKVKEIDNLRSLNDFNQTNVKPLIKQYIEATTSLYVADDDIII